MFQGDSGGPLMKYDPQNDRHTLVGVVAAGIGCGSKIFPGLYTSIDHHREWIEETLKF